MGVGVRGEQCTRFLRIQTVPLDGEEMLIRQEIKETAKVQETPDPSTSLQAASQGYRSSKRRLYYQLISLQSLAGALGRQFPCWDGPFGDAAAFESPLPLYLSSLDSVIRLDLGMITALVYHWEAIWSSSVFLHVAPWKVTPQSTEYKRSTLQLRKPAHIVWLGWREDTDSVNYPLQTSPYLLTTNISLHISMPMWAFPLLKSLCPQPQCLSYFILNQIPRQHVESSETNLGSFGIICKQSLSITFSSSIYKMGSLCLRQHLGCTSDRASFRVAFAHPITRCILFISILSLISFVEQWASVTFHLCPLLFLAGWMIDIRIK